MAIDALNADEETIRQALDYLGASSPMALAERGQLSIPTATGQIAAPAPGGGGGGGAATGGVGGPGPGGSGLETAAKAVSALTKEAASAQDASEPPDLGTRGDGGSLSDQLRGTIPSGAELTGAEKPPLGASPEPPAADAGGVMGGSFGPADTPTPLFQGSVGELIGFPGVSDEVIRNILDATGLGAEGLEGLLGEMNIPQDVGGPAGAAAVPDASVPGGADSSGVGLGSLGGVVTPAIKAAISQILKNADPEVQAAAEGAIEIGAPLAQTIASIAPNIAASALGTGAGAGAGFGAGAGGAAASAASGAAAGQAIAGGAANAVMAAMIISTTINKMLSDQKTAYQLGERVKGLTSSVPGHIAALQKAPALLAKLGPNTTPEEAADIYKQVEAIQQEFDKTGMEDFLQQGRTSVQGPKGMGWMQADFPGGPELFAKLTPAMQAMDLARIRASDIAARGGKPIEGARPIFDYAYNLGSPEFAERARPTSTHENVGQLGQFLYAGMNPDTNPVGASDVATPETLRFLGFTPEQIKTMTAPGAPTPEMAYQQSGEGGSLVETGRMLPGQPTSWRDVQSFLMGAGKNLVDTPGSPYVTSPYGYANREIYEALRDIQPGNYEQGLAEVFNKFGGMHPGLAKMGFGQLVQAGVPPAEALQAVLALGGGSGLGGFWTGGVDPNLVAA